MERGRIQGLPNFFQYPLLFQERVKLRTSNFVGTFIGSIGTKAHENVGNSGRGHIVRESRKFSEHPYVGRIARSSLQWHSFLVLMLPQSVICGAAGRDIGRPREQVNTKPPI